MAFGSTGGINHAGRTASSRGIGWWTEDGERGGIATFGRPGSDGNEGGASYVEDSRESERGSAKEKRVK